jgi:hypothetical protein
MIELILEVIEIIKNKNIRIIEIDDKDIQKTLELINVKLIPIVKQWLNVGFPIKDASEWISLFFLKKSGKDPKEAFEWFSNSFAKEEYEWAKRNDRSMENMKDWKDNGFSLQDVWSFAEQKIITPAEVREKAVMGSLVFGEGYGYDFLRAYRFANLNKKDFIINLSYPDSSDDKNSIVFHFENSNDYGVFVVIFEYPEKRSYDKNYVSEILKDFKIKIKEKYFRDFISLTKNDKYELKLKFFSNRVIIRKQFEESYYETKTLPETKTILPYYEGLEVPEYWIGDEFAFKGVRSDHKGQNMILLASLKIKVGSLKDVDEYFWSSSSFEDEKGEDYVKIPINLKGMVEITLKDREFDVKKEVVSVPSFSFNFQFDEPFEKHNSEMFILGQSIISGRFLHYEAEEMKIHNYEAHTSIYLPYFRKIMEALKVFDKDIDKDIDFKLWIPESDDPKNEECILEISSNLLRMFLLPQAYGG